MSYTAKDCDDCGYSSSVIRTGNTIRCEVCGVTGEAPIDLHLVAEVFKLG